MHEDAARRRSPVDGAIEAGVEFLGFVLQELLAWGLRRLVCGLCHFLT